MKTSKFSILTLFAAAFIFFTSCERPDDIIIDDPIEDPVEGPKPTIETKTVDLQPGVNDLFEAEERASAVYNVRNNGAAPIEIAVEFIVDEDDDVSRTLIHKLDSGCTFGEDINQLISLKALVPADNFGAQIEFKIAYIPYDPGFGGATDWLSSGEVCLDGEVESAPDSDFDCLWDKDILWQSNTPRDIELELTITGLQDITVDIEAPAGIYTSYNVSAPPALPQFQTLLGEWEDVVAVHIQCTKSPVNDCDTCDYEYNLCYK